MMIIIIRVNDSVFDNDDYKRQLNDTILIIITIIIRLVNGSVSDDDDKRHDNGTIVEGI